MNKVKIYGLKNCDTCRKAKRALETNGIDVDFQDVRDSPLSRDLLAKLLDQFGAEKLVNQRSTTWRGLSDSERTHDPLALLSAHPTLMKRPVIEKENTYTLGWTEADEANLS